MGKKNQTKKAPAKNNTPVKKTEENKSVKGIIIAVVALLLVAAVVVTAVLVKKNDDGTKTTGSSGEIETVASEGQYTYAKYKSTTLPVEFVEILTKAEADSAAACKNQGTVLEIGGREISVPEFTMYYYDEYSSQVESVQYSIQKSGVNRTGFDLEIMPAEQNYIRDSGTWEDYFVDEAVSKMKEVYMIFDLAVEAGTKLDVVSISSLIENFELIEMNAESKGTTSDESLSSFYGEGMTSAMYCARDIMMTYAQAYENDKLNEIAAGYTESRLQDMVESDKHAYTVAVGRVYPIEGTYNEAEAAAVTNEQEFLDYANKNYPFEGYDAEYSTECSYVTRETISSVYGDEVGSWMFSDDRKAGDIAVIQGVLFNYLCYIETPPLLSTSRSIIACQQAYSDDMTQETKDNYYNDILAKYDEWKENDGTKEGFLEMSNLMGGTGEITVRVEDYYYEISRWIFDSERKVGDSAMINTSVGCVAIYYMGNNEDDYDWKQYARENLSSEDLTAIYADLKANDYKENRDKQAVKDACKAAEVFIQRKMDKLAAEST